MAHFIILGRAGISSENIMAMIFEIEGEKKLSKRYGYPPKRYDDLKRDRHLIFTGRFEVKNHFLIVKCCMNASSFVV